MSAIIDFTMRNLPGLKPVREARGLSQRELSKVSGVGQGSIWKLETGERQARPTTTRKLSEALEVPREFLWHPPPPTGEKLTGADLDELTRDWREQRQARFELLEQLKEADLAHFKDMQAALAEVSEQLNPDNLEEMVKVAKTTAWVTEHLMPRINRKLEPLVHRINETERFTRRKLYKENPDLLRVVDNSRHLARSWLSGADEANTLLRIYDEVREALEGSPEGGRRSLEDLARRVAEEDELYFEELTHRWRERRAQKAEDDAREEVPDGRLAY